MKKGISKILTVMFLLLMLNVFTVFSSGSQEASGEAVVEDDVKIGISLFYRRDEFYKDLETGFRDGAEKYGWRINLQDADADPNKQMYQIEDFIATRVDAIAFSGADPEGLVPAVLEANKAGIPVFTFDGGVNGGDVVAHVGMDNYQAGVIAGEWTKQYLQSVNGGSGKVVILEFPQSAVVCGDRVKGFKSVIETMSGVEIVAQQDGKASRTESMSVMENILTSQSVIDVVFGINDDTIFGGVAACEAAGRDGIAFISVGWSEELFSKLESGDMYVKASAVQNPYVMAVNCVEAINSYLGGADVPNQILEDAVLVDGSNVNKLGWEEIVDKRK